MTYTPTAANSTEPVRTFPLVRGPTVESLDEAFARWREWLPGSSATSSAASTQAPEVVLPVASAQEMRDLLTAGVTRRGVRMERKQWIREIRVAPTPAPGSTANVHIPTRHMNDAGIPAQVNVAHAEQQVQRMSPGRPIGVSRYMCTDCQNYFRSEATRLNQTLVVAAGLPSESIQVLVFTPHQNPRAPLSG